MLKFYDSASSEFGSTKNWQLLIAPQILFWSPHPKDHSQFPPLSQRRKISLSINFSSSQHPTTLEEKIINKTYRFPKHLQTSSSSATTDREKKITSITALETIKFQLDVKICCSNNEPPKITLEKNSRCKLDPKYFFTTLFTSLDTFLLVRLNLTFGGFSSFLHLWFWCKNFHFSLILMFLFFDLMNFVLVPNAWLDNFK